VSYPGYLDTTSFGHSFHNDKGYGCERGAVSAKAPSVSRIWDLLRKSEWQAADPELETIAADTAQIDYSSRIVVHDDPRGPCADRFRLLRLRLNERWNAETMKTLLITSPLPNDGKSTVALNLATALAERGKRMVLLIGADLHRPTLTKRLGLPERSGLAECLEDGLKPLSAVRRVEPLGWYLLPAGRARGNPTELLQSGAVAEVKQELSRHFDWILIDSPPAIPLADVLALKQRSDASLLVVRAGRTPTESVERSITLLGRKHVFGIVLNGIENFDPAYSKYYSSYGVDASSTR
jgi:succinoglycan biosynthesis transport protein ExoP